MISFQYECVFRDLMKSFASLRLHWINNLEQLCGQIDSFLTSFLVRRKFASNSRIRSHVPAHQEAISNSNVRSIDHTSIEVTAQKILS